MSRGRRPHRIAYVMREWDLPTPVPGAEWQIDQKFNAAEELLRNPKLKVVFKAALEKGRLRYRQPRHRQRTPSKTHRTPICRASVRILNAFSAHCPERGFSDEKRVSRRTCGFGRGADRWRSCRADEPAGRNRKFAQLSGVARPRRPRARRKAATVECLGSKAEEYDFRL